MFAIEYIVEIIILVGISSGPLDDFGFKDLAAEMISDSVILSKKIEFKTLFFSVLFHLLELSKFADRFFATLINCSLKTISGSVSGRPSRVTSKSFFIFVS